MTPTSLEGEGWAGLGGSIFSLRPSSSLNGLPASILSDCCLPSGFLLLRNSVNFQCCPSGSRPHSGPANKAPQGSSPDSLSRPPLTALGRRAPWLSREFKLSVYVPTLLLHPCSFPLELAFLTPRYLYLTLLGPGSAKIIKVQQPSAGWACRTCLAPLSLSPDLCSLCDFLRTHTELIGWPSMEHWMVFSGLITLMWVRLVAPPTWAHTDPLIIAS